MMGKKQKLNGSEVDVVSAWKKFYCCFQRSGVAKKLKKAMSRRFRQEGKKDVRREIHGA
jgi:hypothetical protein